MYLQDDIYAANALDVFIAKYDAGRWVLLCTNRGSLHQFRAESLKPTILTGSECLWAMSAGSSGGADVAYGVSTDR